MSMFPTEQEMIEYKIQSLENDLTMYKDILKELNDVVVKCPHCSNEFKLKDIEAGKDD